MKRQSRGAHKGEYDGTIGRHKDYHDGMDGHDGAVMRMGGGKSAREEDKIATGKDGRFQRKLQSKASKAGNVRSGKMGRGSAGSTKARMAKKQERVMTERESLREMLF